MKLRSWKKNKKIFSSAKSSDTIAPTSVITEPGLSIHTSCKTLPLSKFKPAYCRNDYSGLIISGNPTIEQLQAAWNEILFDYSSLIKNENSDYLFTLYKQISELRWHIWYVDSCCSEGNTDTETPPGVLRIRFDQDLINELEGLGYTIQEEFGTDEYFDRLTMIISLTKTKIFDLEEANDEYERLQKTIGGKQQSEEEFDGTIAMLSKYQGYSIDDDTTTVYRFSIVFNNYLADMKARKKLLDNASGR